MEKVTIHANELIKKMIGKASVESFGISHQILFLEFRNDLREDHILSIETDISSTIVFSHESNLTYEEKSLLLFNKINLHCIDDIYCDDMSNLIIKFDNGIRLDLNGSPDDKASEPWMLASREPVENGGYMIVSSYAGGYAIWNKNEL